MINLTLAHNDDEYINTFVYNSYFCLNMRIIYIFIYN